MQLLLRMGEFLQVCGIWTFSTDCTYHVSDRSSIFCHQSFETSETMTTLYFVGMTVVSVFYIPVNKLIPNLKKKDDLVLHFLHLACLFFIPDFMGNEFFIPASVQGLILTVVARIPKIAIGRGATTVEDVEILHRYWE